LHKPSHEWVFERQDNGERTSNAGKRIPVTEDGWRERSEFNQAEQTDDDLLDELIQEHDRRQLAERTREVREADAEESTPLDERDRPPR
jgi:hypothetical protein